MPVASPSIFSTAYESNAEGSYENETQSTYRVATTFLLPAWLIQINDFKHNRLPIWFDAARLPSHMYTNLCASRASTVESESLALHKAVDMEREVLWICVEEMRGPLCLGDAVTGKGMWLMSGLARPGERVRREEDGLQREHRAMRVTHQRMTEHAMRAACLLSETNQHVKKNEVSKSPFLGTFKEESKPQREDHETATSEQSPSPLIQAPVGNSPHPIILEARKPPIIHSPTSGGLAINGSSSIRSSAFGCPLKLRGRETTPIQSNATNTATRPCLNQLLNMTVHAPVAADMAEAFTAYTASPLSPAFTASIASPPPPAYNLSALSSSPQQACDLPAPPMPQAAASAGLDVSTLEEKMYADIDKWRAAHDELKAETSSLCINLGEESVERKGTVEALDFEVARLKVEIGHLRRKTMGVMETLRRTKEVVARVEGFLRAEFGMKT